jgi:death-on-curing family protein
MYYETSMEQGASIFRSIIEGHMFRDGNKRTGVMTLELFGQLQNLALKKTSELMEVATKIADGKMTDVSEIATAISK